MEEKSRAQELSVREISLIRELAQIRKEHKRELEYEKFDGYELPPRTQFSMLNKPAVSIKYGVMKFKQESENISNLDKLLKIKEESFNKKIYNSNPYVKLARESLNYYFKYKRLMIASNDLPREMLEERHGVFVSLKKFGQLRGCIESNLCCSL